MIIIQQIVLILQEKRNYCKAFMYESSAKVPKYLDCGLLIDPMDNRGHILHFNFLQLHYRRCKITHVGLLTVVASPCNSHVNYITLKIGTHRVLISNYCLFLHVYTIF